MMRFPANRLFCLALLLMVILVAACGTPVTRSLSTAEPGAGEIFIVSLSTRGHNPRRGGRDPAGRLHLRGDGTPRRPCPRPWAEDRVCSDERYIDHLLGQGPASGSGDITGEWEDFIAESHGQVAASHVAVDGIEAPGVGNPSTTEVQAGSPYTALIAVAGLLLVAYRGDRR